jgi:hypothetical protein
MNDVSVSVLNAAQRAVSSAIDAGVSAEDFKKLIASEWHDHLVDKARRDLKVFDDGR